MSVEIWFRDSLDSEVVRGDLQTLVNDLNIANAQGKAFTILADPQGDGILIQTRNILKAREAKDEDALIG